jgi:SAM-dependent methyltransferase
VIVPFTLPPQSPGKPIPNWVGNGFRVGGKVLPVLEYSSNAHGWTDDLTTMHEETAGSDHFIDRASRQHALEQVCKYVKGKTPVILEVGCSSGFMLRLIRDRLTDALVMGSDVVHDPLEQLAAKFPDVPLFRFDLTHCPLPDNSVDAVVMLNVLEHIENDTAAMQQVYRILKPDGILVVEVPAGPHLYDVYDKLLRHYRRYTSSSLRGLVKRANFQIIEQSHLGFLMYPGFWLVKQRNKRFLSEESAAHRRIVEKNIRDSGGSPLLKAIMQLELALGRWVSYPLGIRCLLTSSKPKAPDDRT